MKGKTTVRDVQSEAAVFRAHTDVGDLCELHSWGLTTFNRCIEEFGHVDRQLYFWLGLWAAFYFFARARVHPLQGRVRCELPRSRATVRNVTAESLRCTMRPIVEFMRKL